VGSVERRSVQSADNGVEYRVGRVLRAAMHRLKECPVKLQSARAVERRGCSLDVSSVMYTPSRIDDEYRLPTNQRSNWGEVGKWTPSVC
jgi:hypothetical protein